MSELYYFDEFKPVDKEVVSDLASKLNPSEIVSEFPVLYPHEAFPEGLVIMITDDRLNIVGFAKFQDDRGYFDLISLVKDVFYITPVLFNISGKVGLMPPEDKVVGFRDSEEIEDIVIEVLDRYDRINLGVNDNELEVESDKDINVEFQGVLGDVELKTEIKNYRKTVPNYSVNADYSVSGFKKLTESRDGFTPIDEAMEEAGFFDDVELDFDFDIDKIIKHANELGIEIVNKEKKVDAFDLVDPPGAVKDERSFEEIMEEACERNDKLLRTLAIVEEEENKLENAGISAKELMDKVYARIDALDNEIEELEKDEYVSIDKNMQDMVDYNDDFFKDYKKNVEETKNVEDIVNNPSHYNMGDIEVITYIEQQAKVMSESGVPPEIIPHICNAIKYLSRFQSKGKPVQDLEKSIFYINKSINKLKGE